MSRRARFGDDRLQVVRLATVGVVWLAGLGAGFFAFLAGVARSGCSSGDDAFACHTSGSVVGWLLVAAVIAVVTAVTLTTLNRPARGVLIIGSLAFAALVCCFVAAHSLMATA
ncbi:MAG TPA: hypothetical protein VE442_03025 [Jatrophihabitans sp.]|nr:hypothetical protein [Jatrophihabitans sp.]